MDTKAHQSPTRTLAEEHLHELLREFDSAMLITRSQGDSLHSRPMRIAQIAKASELWFVTGADTPKAEELRRDPRVTVSMQSKMRYLSIDGTAEIVTDRVKIQELWRESRRIWFRDKSDPNIALLRVHASEAEYWDDSGINGIKFALRTAAAYIKGEKIQDEGHNDPKTHAKLSL